MPDFFRGLFDSSFMPHGHCYRWEPEILWLHALSDGAIAFAYYTIPFLLIYIVRKRQDLAFPWIFVMFGAFIVLCGTTHVMEIWSIWNGAYRMTGAVKAVTGAVSVATAFALVPLVPRVLALVGPEQLRAVNDTLRAEIEARERVEQELRDLNLTLERRVAERTAELEQTNADLHQEVAERERVEHLLRELNHTLEERVEERTEQVRELATALTLAEQTERRRVAQVLHDGLQQQLYGAQLPLKMLEEDLQQAGQPTLRENAGRAYRYVAEAIETARHLMVDLSPPVLQGGGLREALLWLATQMQERFGLRVEVHGDDELSVPTDDMRVLLFQTVRELLFNVVKHAETSRVHVSLREEDAYLTIEVVDEGVGFEARTMERPLPTESGSGLYHARERLGLFGGRMEVVSGLGEGTHITITVPIKHL